MPSCCAHDYEKVFGRKAAMRDAQRFRRHGLRGSAKDVADLAGDVHGATVLEVGGGVGAIELQLLAEGAAQATNIELSGTYEDAAASLIDERGLQGRVDRRIADFVDEEASVEPHDVVVLHRVVCCYPDVDALVGAAASHARRRLVLTYPRERVLIRVALSAVNAVLRMRGSTFQVYVHPAARIAAAADAHGLELAERRRNGLVWETAAFAR